MRQYELQVRSQGHKVQKIQLKAIEWLAEFALYRVPGWALDREHNSCGPLDSFKKFLHFVTL